MKPISTFLLILSLIFNYQIVNSQNLSNDLPTDKHISQFIIEKWGEEDGLPSLTLNRVLQTKDGYLWISSFNGLYRFDGVGFQVFDKNNILGLQTNTFLNLHETKEGDLLVGTASSGVFKYKNGKLLKVKDNFNKSVEAVFQDEKGDLWIGTRQNGVYQYAVQQDSIVSFTLCGSLEGKTVTSFVRTEDGNIWIGVDGKGLIRFDGKECHIYAENEGLTNLQISYLFKDEKGVIWIGTTKGLYKMENGKIDEIVELKHFPVNFIYEDRAKSLWIGTNEGIIRRNNTTNKYEILNENNGLPNNFIMGITQDMEGSIWLSTYRAGLVRLRDGIFTAITPIHGISAKTISGVTNFYDSLLLIATESGKLHVLNQIKVSEFAFKTSLENPRIKHLIQDSQRNIWLCTYSGLLKISPDGKEYLYDMKNGLQDSRTRIIYEDIYQQIWVGTRTGGVTKINKDNSLITYTKGSGLSSPFIMSIVGDNEGNIYVGTNDAGIDIIKKDGTFQNLSVDAGLPSKLVFSIRPDLKENQVFWIGTNAGLSSYKDGKFWNVNVENGLSSDVIFDVLEDNNGNLWCSSSVGVFKISKANLFEFWTGGINKIESKLYGTRDGMPEKECTGATPSYISKNGKLLFPTLGGLAILDPYRNTFNELSPPVDIHSFIVDGNSFDVYESNLTLSAGSQRLIFKFSGLSFIAPQKVHFKYKLTGVDKQWVDAQYERQAVYTALSPGEYTFNVIASNNDGVWNEVGKNIKFTLEPHFYQTNWFYAFCILALLGFGHLVYTLRVRQIEHEKKELEKIVKERTAEISQQKEEIEAQRDQLASQSRKLELAYNDIKAVSEIGQEVTSILNFEDLVNATYNHVKSLMYVDYFAIGSYQENSKTLDFDFAFEKNERLPSFQESINDNYRLSVKCLEGKKVIFINSASKEYKELEQYKSLNKNHYGIDTQSVLYVPLVFKEKPVGVLTVQSYRENAYVEQHATILQAMASYISIALENSRNYMIITEKNEQITDSIRYAKTIQQAVLPSLESMNEVFSELMVVYRPKDIVSGDFYWFNHFEKTTFFAVADCTGHGVPGAFMSMIGISILNEIVNVKKITQTDQILEMLNLGVYDALSQEEGKNKDGMDISLCKFVRLADSSMQMEFSGAKRGFWLWQKGQNEMIEIKGTSKTIGGNMIRKDRAFEKHEWLIEKGDTIYMQTDGLADQCNPEREKFGSQNIKEIIARVYTQPLLLQKDTLIKELDEFQSLAKQRDDITFIGLRI